MKNQIIKETIIRNTYNKKELLKEKERIEKDLKAMKPTKDLLLTLGQIEYDNQIEQLKQNLEVINNLLNG